MIKTGQIDPRVTPRLDDTPKPGNEKQAAADIRKQTAELENDPAKRFADVAAR